MRRASPWICTSIGRSFSALVANLIEKRRGSDPSIQDNIMWRRLRDGPQKPRHYFRPISVGSKLFPGVHHPVISSRVLPFISLQARLCLCSARRISVEGDVIILNEASARSHTPIASSRLDGDQPCNVAVGSTCTGYLHLLSCTCHVHSAIHVLVVGAGSVTLLI